MKNIVTYKVVWACAWCPRETWQPLQQGEQWTHGICPKHLAELKEETRQSKLKETLLTSI